jgi:transcriptional regulator with XRE-family HTH domain
MGRSRQPRPDRLAEKLKQIRLKMELTQADLLNRLSDEKTSLHLGYIGLFETGERIPSLLVLLKYSRVSGVNIPLVCPLLQCFF